MQLNYKASIELAEEAAINTVLAENRYEDTRKRMLYDLTTLGVGMAKHEFVPGDGVVAKYVDPANVVYSYTEDPNFNDCYYWGEVKTVPIGEVLKIDPTITSDELKEIGEINKDWTNSYRNSQYYDTSVFSGDNVTLLYFQLQDNKEICL